MAASSSIFCHVSARNSLAQKQPLRNTHRDTSLVHGNRAHVTGFQSRSLLSMIAHSNADSVSRAINYQSAVELGIWANTTVDNNMETEPSEI